MVLALTAVAMSESLLPSRRWFWLAVGASSFCLIAFTWNWFGATVRRAEAREAQAQGALDTALAEIKSEHDLLGLMQANRKQMDAYDAQARSQGVTSHWISVGAMVVGLVIVGTGLTITVLADTSAAKYSAAIVAAVGTATGGYIAQTFIRLNSSIQDQVRYYFEQPLVQSYLLMAERFIAQMPPEERTAQYQLLVESALAQAASARQQQGGPDRAIRRRVPRRSEGVPKPTRRKIVRSR
ncbi:hypothetical protein [Nocardia blacklockiae]|uniref:hypothetical protein n=1 Tax=Nocardia blacklockiae TaxID=480036 RepID=UPI001895FC7E|nr:hypothetical protein [Nocardia blacklockiae]MBF6173588.1 hypothetical protein [Nocardia blacklockiae]